MSSQRLVKFFFIFPGVFSRFLLYLRFSRLTFDVGEAEKRSFCGKILFLFHKFAVAATWRFFSVVHHFLVVLIV